MKGHYFVNRGPRVYVLVPSGLRFSSLGDSKVLSIGESLGSALSASSGLYATFITDPACRRSQVRRPSCSYLTAPPVTVFCLARASYGDEKFWGAGSAASPR
jgi:hypothetical protein